MSIYVDGCCNNLIKGGSTVCDNDKVDLLRKHKDYLDKYDFLQWFDLKEYNGTMYYAVSFTDVKTQQNNGAELVAFAIGLILAIKYDYKFLFSDSDLIVKYWSNKISDTIKDKRKQKIQRFVVMMSNIFRKNGGTIKWVCSKDNISDMGFKKR